MELKPKLNFAAILLTSLVFFWTFVAAVFDAGCLFEYFPRVLLGAVAIASVLAFLPFWPKAALGSAIFLTLWLTVLFPIRWNILKSFYIDSHSLHAGMSMEEVRRVMHPYLEVGSNYAPSGDMPAGIFSAYMGGVSESDDEHESRILFIPSEEYAADWCVVYPKDGVVSEVTIHPD